MKEKKKEKLVSPNGHAPAVIGRQDEIFLSVAEDLEHELTSVKN